MPQSKHAVFYQLYFQEPGVAEAELERDTRRTIRRLLFSGSGNAGGEAAIGNPEGIGMVPRGGGFLDRGADPATLPAWLTEADVDYFAGEIGSYRIPWRAQLVPQHRPQPGAAGA